MKKNNLKKIEKFIEDIKPFFQLNNFESTIKFEKIDKNNFLCEICYEEDYQRITIFIYPIFFTRTKEEQRKYLLHEMFHTITLPSTQLSYNFLSGILVTNQNIKDINERTTSQLENMFDKLLSGKEKNIIEIYKNYLK